MADRLLWVPWSKLSTKSKLVMFLPLYQPLSYYVFYTHHLILLKIFSKPQQEIKNQAHLRSLQIPTKHCHFEHLMYHVERVLAGLGESLRASLLFSYLLKFSQTIITTRPTVNLIIVTNNDRILHSTSTSKMNNPKKRPADVDLPMSNSKR